MEHDEYTCIVCGVNGDRTVCNDCELEAIENYIDPHCRIIYTIGRED